MSGYTGKTDMIIYAYLYLVHWEIALILKTEMQLWMQTQEPWKSSS
jgi:hypothetical protein